MDGMDAFITRLAGCGAVVVAGDLDDVVIIELNCRKIAFEVSMVNVGDLDMTLEICTE